MSKAVHKKPIQKPEMGKKNNLPAGLFSNWAFAFVSILILSIIIYSGSITKIFIALDDQVYINDNPFIKSISWQNIKNIFSSFYNGNYHPLTTLLYAIEFKLFRNDASSYHVVSLIIHILNSFLVFILIEKFQLRKGFALFGSLIFAIHPMHVESIVWISEQKDVLYSLFYFAGLISYINYISERNKKYLFLTFLFFLFSMLSKSAAVTFPLILVLCDFYFRRKWNSRTIFEKIPFFIMALIFGIISIYSQNSVGAINDETMVPYSHFQRIFVVSYALLYYIYKFIFPVDLCVLHYAPETIPYYYYLSPLILILIGWMTWRIKQFNRSLVFGLLFYIFSIILVVQIIPVGYVIVSERYSYVPYVGLLFICGTLITIFSPSKNSILRLIRKNLKIIFTFILLFFSYLSFQYIKKWQSSVLLFTDIVEKNPQSAYAFYSLGKVQNVSGDPIAALKSFDHSIQLNSSIPETYFCRANIYLNQKKYDLAIVDYLKAEKLKPVYPDNLNNIAFLYSETGRIDKAIQYYSKAIAANPVEYLYQRRATCYASIKNYSEALKDYNRAIEINPLLAEAYFNCGVCYYYVQQLEKACEDWKKASSMGYDKANNLLGKYCQ